jgi:hypothetical protein
MNSIKYLKTSFNILRVATIVVLMAYPGWVSAEQKDENQKQAIDLSSGSTHPGTTGEVKLELEEFFLGPTATVPEACNNCQATTSR